MNDTGCTRYPRVLIVSKSRINEVDGNSAMLRSWFHEWPRTSLAQLYSGGNLAGDGLCGTSYRLGAAERRFGNVFERLKGDVQQGPEVTSSPRADECPPSVKARLGHWVMRSGIWEPIFTPHLSPALCTWVEGFRPDVMLVQGFDLSFLWLPLAIHRRYGVPICLHVPDDWPDFLYADTAAALLMRPMVSRTMRAVCRVAGLRYGMSPMMAQEYTARYRTPFEAVMHCGDPLRYASAPVRRVVDGDEVGIVYCGALGHQRWRALVDLCQVARQLSPEIGRRIVVVACCSAVPADSDTILNQQENLRLLPPPADADVPSILKGADLLFLPESFDPAERKQIRLSLSTKAFMYMMAERPVLTYGPPEVGTVEYARRGGWSLIVDTQEQAKLMQAVRALLTEQEVGARLVSQGRAVARQYHDARLVRAQLRTALCQLADTSMQQTGGGK